MSVTNLFHSRLENARHFGTRINVVEGGDNAPLTLNPQLPGTAYFFNPTSGVKMVILPVYENGLVYALANYGSSNVEIYRHDAILFATLKPGKAIAIICSDTRWRFFGDAGDPVDLSNVTGYLVAAHGGTVLDGTGQEITAASDTLVATTTTLFLNRDTDMTINLPPLVSCPGVPIRVVDITATTAERDRTWVPDGADTILGGSPNFVSHHSNVSGGEVVVNLYPYRGAHTMWVIR